MKKTEIIYFNGIWRKAGDDDIYLFTDGVTGSTFTVEAGGDFMRTLIDMRARFGKSFPDNNDLIYPR